MGAVCGRPNKPKPDRNKAYLDANNNNDNNSKFRDIKENPSDRSLNPAQAIGNETSSPARISAANAQQENKEFQDNGERRITEDGLKDSFVAQLQGRDTDRAGNDGLPKFSVKVQGTVTNLDQNPRGQTKPLYSEPVSKPRSIVMPANSYGNVEQGGNAQGSTENLFEAIYHDKTTSEDYYLDLNENYMKKYEQFQANTKFSIKPKVVGTGLNQGQNPGRSQSQVLEWSKLLQKHFSQDKGPITVYDNRMKLQKTYKMLLGLDERNWYEEAVMLYKEKIATSKTTGNMTRLTFDRKIIQLQEQFRWLVSAVANTRLNPSNIIGVHEFPPYKVFNRKKGDKLDTSSVSLARGQYSVTGSDDISEILSPVRSQHSQMNYLSSARAQIGGFTYLENPPDPRENYYSEFPDIFSPAWQEGFVWKGVYLKLYSKTEAKQLKKELKVLKHMGIEYLQTETSAKFFEAAQSISLNPNESIEGTKSYCGQTVNAILPLICTVESSSWVLLGTPIFPVKKALIEDNVSKLGLENIGFLKNTFLLSNLKSSNFKLYHKAEENQHPILQTFGSLNPSAVMANINQANANFLLMTNVGKTVISLPKVNVMMIISQEINSNVSFLEYPRKGLEPEMIKKMLGYADEDIGLEALLVNKRNKNETWDRDSKIGHDLYFEVLKFKRGGWMMQMIYLASKRTLPPTFVTNKRAMDLLSHSDTKKMIEIKGNVLLFGYLPNTDSLLHPYYISEQTFTASFAEEADSDKNVGLKGSKLSVPNTTRAPKQQANPSQLLEAGSFVGRESFVRGSFTLGKSLKEEKIVQDFFGFNVGKSIESVVEQLENSDTIVNFASLKELFHRKGVNMRFEWIVYARLRREKAKVLVGTDILVRCMKKLLEEKTSKRLKYFRKQQGGGQMDPTAQKKKMDEIIQDKTDFFMEDFYKKALCLYVNALIRDENDNLESEANEMVFQDLSTNLFLHRMRAFDIARKCLSANHFDYYLSADITKTIMNVPCLHANTFLDAISHHFQISLNYDIVRQIRNDKYIHWVSNQGLLLKPTDLNILYANDYYLTTAERCYLLLLKFPQHPSENSIELTLPAALYKLRRPRLENDLQMSFDCFLHDRYEIPDLEILNDWVVLLESALNGLYTPDGQQNLLIEGYILQMVLAFFSEDNDNQMTRSILEKINSFANTLPVTSPELSVVIHTWYGILAESKLFSECEQSYSIALLILHKLYGDPRGRGGNGTPWELFITSRLSILSRLQGRQHDAEYTEELFDATLMTLRDNPANAYAKSHYIYTDPFKAFQSTYNTAQQNELSHLQNKLSLKSAKLNDHPFPHWVNHLAFDETSAKIDTLNSTLEKTPALLKWMITYMPIFQPTGIRWDTAYLRDFFLSIMQSTFSNTTSVSSVSNVSMERGNRSAIGLDLSAGQRLSGIKSDKRDRKFNPAGSLVYVLEKDASTLSKREINGTVYSWGQNDRGQVGSLVSGIEDIGIVGKKKLKVYYPRRIVTLKDTIIQSVACGHSHSMAITLDGQLLAWGDNRHGQLGLGSKAPAEVFVPSLVLNLKDVTSVSCGNEHTAALTKAGWIYSWGEGEEGLLGHGDTRPQNVPKRIEALRNMEVQAVACGGLHTLALTKQGVVYVWGKGEGGQLGIPVEQLTRNSDNHVYLNTPTRIRGALDGQVVTQIACGDAHSLALTQRGYVYSWGYSYQGQLGLGITSENMDMNQPCQVNEPTLIQKLTTVKIAEVFAGATFSMFLTDKKELYGCGLNESNQLGLEKNNVTKVGGQLERIAASKPMDTAYPKKLDCFTSQPVLKVACGEAHSLALVFCENSYTLFSWGLQKQAQLGIGEAQVPNSTPKKISFLQYVMAYSMGCGSFHSLVVLGEPSKTFRKEALIERLEKKSENRWMSAFFEAKGSYESMIEMALNNLDNIIPSEEGKIVNPKAIRKTPTQS